MKTVILAGGLGTRLSEETQLRPKPMVEIGGFPILWHIMKIYSTHGLKDFIICLGYKGHIVKEYFYNSRLASSDIRISSDGHVEYLNQNNEDWTITLIDTGPNTQTGGRLKRIASAIPDENFCMTYGDGLADVNIGELVKFHKQQTNLATVTATRPAARFGALEMDGHKVKAFVEKPITENGWINGGFFVLNKQVLDYIDGDETPWEREPMQKLASSGNLGAFKHEGFWQPMDTLREKHYLEDLWAKDAAPWKVWK